MKKIASLTLSLLLLAGPAFADSTKDTPKGADVQPAKAAATAKPATAKTSAEIAAEVEELRQTLQAQQEQLQMLKEELAKRDREIEATREAAASANAKATDASVKATEAVATSAEVKTTTTALNSSVASLASSNAAAVNAAVAAKGGAGDAEEKGPTTIRFKGVNITPGGFIAAETVNRQRAESADINTQFNGIPYAANATGKLSEMNLTGRQSRLSMLVDGKVGDAKLIGYYEMDFLGVGTTSNNRQSNSYMMRQRQLFARAEFASGWSFTGGQMWSLATENKTGIINRNEWTPAVIDPQYVVGFTWARQYGFRVTKNFGDKFAIAFAAEGPQATVTAHGTSTYTSTSGATTTNTFYDSPGNGAGLYNAFDTTGYSINKAPDFIVKMALDPGWGHYEVFGILSTFQNRVYPCAVVSIQAPTATAVKYTSPDGTVYTGSYNSAVLSGAGALTPPSGCTNTTPSAVGAYTDSRTGGGFGGSFDVPLVAKKFDLGLKAFYGDGTGRYGSSQLPDATLRPDGTLALIHGAHWLGRAEWHVTPKFDLYAYVGGEYAARSVYSGFLSVTGSTSTTNVTLQGTPMAAGDPLFITLPETVTTWKTSNTGIGGYGYQTANNSTCSTEVAPSAVGTPSGGSCVGDTRYIGEGSLGFWHKFYQGDKGRFQWGIQYSYFYKTGWSGTGGLTAPTAGIGPHAVDNMVWTSFRYYLP
jgi:hypothetical protein